MQHATFNIHLRKLEPAGLRDPQVVAKHQKQRTPLWLPSAAAISLLTSEIVRTQAFLASTVYAGWEYGSNTVSREGGGMKRGKLSWLLSRCKFGKRPLYFACREASAERLVSENPSIPEFLASY